MRASAFLVPISFGAALLSGCPLEEDRTPGDCDEFSSVFTIQDRMQQSVDQFIVGEAITFRMEITNTNNAPEALTNPDACPQVRFEVLDRNNQIVWSSAEGIACAQVVSPINYEPGQTRTYSVEWLQLRRNGQPIPVGQYTARAVDRTECSEELSKSDSFSIS